MIDAFTGMSLWVVDSEGNLLTYGPLRLERKLYPVGQGSFYAERFMDGDICKACVVYDCGSRKKEKVQDVVGNEFDRQHSGDIDALFISHLHEDHINGIESLRKKHNVKRVFLPFLYKNLEIRRLLFLYEIASRNVRKDKLENLYRIMCSYEDVFGDKTSIIYVRAFDDNEDVSVNGFDLTALDNGKEIGSFQSIRIDSLWKYTPFNFNVEEKYKAFKAEIEQSGLRNLLDLKISYKEILDVLAAPSQSKEKAGTAKKNFDLLKDIYGKVSLGTNRKEDLNKDSMMLYSGPVDTESVFNVEDCLGINNCTGIRETKKIKEKAGCLYLGDMDMNQEYGLAGCRRRVFDIICAKLESDLPQLDMVQVPHHGSADSYSSKLLELNAKTEHYFVSYGKINRYGHPSSDVVKDIASQGKLLSCVTEDKKSLCTISYHFPEKVWGKPEEKGTSDAPQAN